MNIFYGSEFYQNLYDESTGLYLEGTKYLYGLLETEIENGKLIQNEILIKRASNNRK